MELPEAELIFIKNIIDSEKVRQSSINNFFSNSLSKILNNDIGL